MAVRNLVFLHNLLSKPKAFGTAIFGHAVLCFSSVFGSFVGGVPRTRKNCIPSIIRITSVRRPHRAPFPGPASILENKNTTIVWNYVCLAKSCHGPAPGFQLFRPRSHVTSWGIGDVHRRAVFGGHSGVSLKKWLRCFG